MHSSLAHAEGVRAVFAFPIRIGAVRLGGLLIYRLDSGPLTNSQLSDCYLMASIIARAILALQAGATCEAISRELERAATIDFVVQQAAGMISVQGAVSILDALVLLRAHGFSTGMSSSELSARVVSRDLHYEPLTLSWSNSDGSNHELLV